MVMVKLMPMTELYREANCRLYHGIQYWNQLQKFFAYGYAELGKEMVRNYERDQKM